MDVIFHATYAEQFVLVVLAVAIEIHVQVSLMVLADSFHGVLRAPYYMVVELCICHSCMMMYMV